MAEKEVSNLTKLDGQNFVMWKFGVSFLLQSRGLTEYIDGTSEEPDKTTKLTEWVKWKKEMSRTAVILLGSVEQSLHVNLINCTTPKEMWEKLSKLYGDTSEDAKQLAWQQYYEFHIKDGQSITTQIEVFESICKKLENSGEKLSEASVMTKLLNSLPRRFSTFSMAWECTPLADRKKDNLTARILKEEKRLNETDASMNALALQINTLNVKKRDGKGKEKKKKNIEELKKNTKCNFCHIKGHWYRECPKRKAKKSTEEKNGEKSDDVSTYICDVSLFYSSTSESDADVWIADSGASMHMTSRRDLFSEFFEDSEFGFVKVADNKVLPTAGIGTVEIQVVLNGKVFDRRLSKVLYVPGLKRNLFSVGAATEKNFSFHCFKDHCEVRDKEGILSAVGVRNGKLFHMNFLVKTVECNVATSHSLKLWHERFSHISVQRIKNTSRVSAVRGLEINDTTNFLCESCIMANQTCKPHFSSKQEKAFKPGEMIYSDVCGPVNIPSPSGSKYFLLFKDECTGFRVVYFLRNKSEVFAKMKEFEALVLRQTGNNIKVLRTDNGTEYKSNDFAAFLRQKGIIHEKSSPYIHEQNGRAEREIRTLVSCARAMLVSRNVSKALWTEAVKTASYILNRTISRQCISATPYEQWFGHKPDVKHIRVFGSIAYMHVPKEKQVSKFDPRSKKLLFVGYDGDSSNYRLYDQETGKIHVSSDVVFDEVTVNPTPKLDNTFTIDLSFENVPDDVSPAVPESVPGDAPQDVPENAYEDVLEDESVDHETPDAEVDPTEVRQLRDRDQIQRPIRFEDYEAFLTEVTPATYEMAVSCPEARKWHAAMKEEMDALQDNNTWIMTSLPPGKRLIGCKWVYKLKTDSEGNIQRYKARLVAKGFTQREGLDYSETFAPVVRYESIRMLLAIAASEDLEISKFDVKTAFLNGDLEEELYMEPPPGLEQQQERGLVCKLQRSLYGLKQAPRCWNSKFVNFLNQFHFMQIESDKCVFIGNISEEKVYLALYVDDGLVISRSTAAINKILQYLKKCFQITIDDANLFVGLQLARNKLTHQISIKQTSYIKKIITKFKMEDAKPSAIPMDPGKQLHRPKEEEKLEGIPYREAIGALLFVARLTRPDIEFAVNRLSQFLTCYGQEHWNAVKTIIRYLKGTLKAGIVYGSSGSNFKLRGYTDADYAGCSDTRKSTSGFVFVLNGGPITWSSQKQDVVALSTTEAEYIALAHGVKDAIWIRRFLNELGIPMDYVSINVDNQSAIKLASNPEFHKRSKHIEVRYHFIRQIYERGEIKLDYIQSKHQLADLFTKPLPKQRFSYLRQELDVGVFSETN